MVEHRHIAISKRIVALNSFATLSARIVNIAVLVWVYQYLLRRLPAEEFAILPLVTSLMVFGPLLFHFFIGSSARYMVDFYARGDFEGMRSVVSSLFSLLAVFSVILVPLLVIFTFNIDYLFRVDPSMVGETRVMMLLLMLGFVFQMLIFPFTTAFTVAQKFVERRLIEVARDLLRAALTVVLILYFDPAVVWVVVATVISEALSNVVKLLRSFKVLPEVWFDRRLVSLPLARELIHFGLWTALGQLGTTMYTHAATLILNLYGTPVDLTAYHVGATFFRHIESTVKLAASPLQPAITAMNALNDRDRLARTILRGGRYALWISMLIVVPLIIFSKEFILLYVGPEYSIAATVLVLFMTIFPFTQPTVLLATLALAKRELKPFFLPAFLFQLTGFIIMLVATRALAMGAVGVTFALAATTVLSQVLYFWRLCVKMTETSFLEFMRKTLVPGLLPSFAGALAWLTLRIAHPPHSWDALFVEGIVGSMVYTSVLVIICLDVAERKSVVSLVARIPGRRRYQ